MNPFDQLAPVCPKCGSFALQVTGKFGIKSMCCDLWSWNGKPLVDRETHVARIRAHEAFDPLWKTGSMDRKAAYRWLKQQLGWSKDPHMSEMNADEARQVVAVMARSRT